MIKPFLLALLFAGLEVCCSTALGADLSGVVADENGKPLAHVTVMVYHAGVKTGYSTYCPSCYADCGKRVVTDAKGAFVIRNLAADLRFELLAAGGGYVPAFTKKVDPVQISTVAITLAARPKNLDLSGTVRGRVVDADGSPVRDAVIQPTGLMVNDNRNSAIGSIPGLDPIAVSDDQGNFEIAYEKPTSKMLLNIEARAMAPKFVVMTTGQERHSVALSDGAAITGRLLVNGKPLGNAEVGLIAKHRGGIGDNLVMLGDPYDEVRIGTKRDGSFTLTNIPEPGDWYLYAKMNSVSQVGASTPVEVKTSRDKEFIRAGDLTIKPGYRLKGKVVVSDQKAIPDGMRISINSERVWDSQTVSLRNDGSFEFANLPAGAYSINPSLKGYQVKGTKYDPFNVPVSIDHDVDGFTVTVYPKTAQQ